MSARIDVPGLDTPSGAVFDGPYRYLLWRDVSPLTGRGTLLVCMLNPSTADGKKNDRTTTKVVGFAAAAGYARVELVNLFAMVATNWLELGEHKNPIGPENDRYIEQAVHRADAYLVAWGGLENLRRRLPKDGRGLPRLALTRKRLDLRRNRVLSFFPSPLCLGTTADGEPRHPLYLAKTTAIEPYIPPGDPR